MVTNLQFKIKRAGMKDKLINIDSLVMDELDPNFLLSLGNDIYLDVVIDLTDANNCLDYVMDSWERVTQKLRIDLALNHWIFVMDLIFIKDNKVIKIIKK